jgi:DNA-binding response OmpR family regulator
VRVLVTEDDARMASLLGQALTEADHVVRVVGSGERAIDALSEDAYDLVLLDVMLPRLDGFATCRRMRERGATMAVLMLTARDDVEDRVRGLDAGADDYLCKPFSTSRRAKAPCSRCSCATLGELCGASASLRTPGRKGPTTNPMSSRC